VNDDEAFKLNSLHRFTKHSKLVLEAHSHCEVPAGCGGAVFKWVNPTSGIELRLQVRSSLDVEAVFFGAHGRPTASRRASGRVSTGAAPQTRRGRAQGRHPQGASDRRSAGLLSGEAEEGSGRTKRGF